MGNSQKFRSIIGTILDIPEDQVTGELSAESAWALGLEIARRPPEHMRVDARFRGDLLQLGQGEPGGVGRARFGPLQFCCAPQNETDFLFRVLAWRGSAVG